MENSGSKGEFVKPILLMAGIPLAFSVAGFLIARLTERKIPSLRDQIVEISQEMEIPGRHSHEGCGDDEDISDYIINTHERNPLEEQLLALRSKIEELQAKEWEIEDRFFRYNDLKDQEYALMEFQNSLVIEKERAEFLEREVSSMEAQNKKFDEMMIDYLKALEELKSSRFENGLLRKRVKKLLKKTRVNARLVNKHKLKIEAREAEISSNDVELNRKENTIREFENEVKDLHEIITELQDEKNELLNKLMMAENSASLKAEAEGILMEEKYRLMNELEQIQKDRAAEVQELICLRLRHACLKHELMRKNQQGNLEGDHTDEPGLDAGRKEDIEACLENESIDNNSVMHHDDPFFGFTTGDQRHPKRPWLVRKLKKWVDAREKEKHHELRFSGSHSAADEAEERPCN